MLLVNPRAAALGEHHVILNGRGRDYHVRDFPGPLSIKSVVRGAATWQTDEGRFDLRPGACVVVNDHQPYSVTVESRDVVETFCLFFERGFVEDIGRAVSSSDAELLDNPWEIPALRFHERVHHSESAVLPLLSGLYRRRDDQVLVMQLAESLVRLETEAVRAARNLTASKWSTKVELLRRVQRGRNVMEGSLSQGLSLREVARQAALSPYHFHRSFTRLLGETPHSYVTRRRLERAESLLKQTRMPVTEVCLECGFQSVSSFSGLFRAHTGASPKEFRRLET